MAAPYLCHTNTPPICIPSGSEFHHHQPGADGGQLGSGHDHMDRWQDPESEARCLRDVVARRDMEGLGKCGSNHEK